MFDFLYYILIFPLEQLIEISFIIIYRIFKDKVLAIIGVSAVFTVCTMPLYFMAEKFQKAERDIQKRLKPKIDIFKSVFKGDERFMILSTYYRQNNYHPIYALRSSLGIFIQIPFFLAAYHYLSNLDFIKGTSFLYINDLGSPDRFISFENFSINLLPILMTLINLASGIIYTKGFLFKDKMQVYGIALLFLILLYNSPSGLVLYWTMNNIFSLIKNILVKIKYWKKIIYIFLCLCAILVFIRFIPAGLSPKRLFVICLSSLVFFIPLYIKFFKYIKTKIMKTFNLEKCALSFNYTFILSSLILFILSGLVIPGALISSSVQEFSFLDSYTTPLPFIYTVLIQSAGIFVFWPLCIYFLFSKNIKYILSFILSILCVIALLNTFIFQENYGSITSTFRFSNPDTFESKYLIIIINSLITLCVVGIFTWLLFSKCKIIFNSFQIIILIALAFFGLYNIAKINNNFLVLENKLKYSADEISNFENPEPVFTLSKNGKNVIVLMLDSAISGYIPYIFNEKPELYQNYSGFIYYPNNISFGVHTRIGAPLIFGGYEYKPENIQKNRSYTMEKHNEALLTMPLIFHKNKFNVTVTDPTFANYSLIPDLSIFASYQGISVQNIQGKYTGNWLRSHPETKIVSIPKLLKDLLIRFSFFKISPSLFKVFIYDKAEWLKPKNSLTDNNLSLNTLDSYTALDYFPLITKILDNNINTYTAIVNDLPHDAAILQYPDYIPAIKITNQDGGAFSGEDHYHTNMAAIFLTGNWLKFLQEQGVYDNTRIIIASDHGKNVKNDYEGNMQLPDGRWLSNYHALLLVKDFNSNGTLITDNNFMTQGDVPFIAMENLIYNPQNPFSGNHIKPDKENGVVLTTADELQYSIKNDQWLYVRDNIFNIDNWKQVVK